METVQTNLTINYLIMVNRINPIVPKRTFCVLFMTSKLYLFTVFVELIKEAFKK